LKKYLRITVYLFRPYNTQIDLCLFNNLAKS